jgi:hypothetical protein
MPSKLDNIEIQVSNINPTTGLVPKSNKLDNIDVTPEIKSGGYFPVGELIGQPSKYDESGISMGDILDLENQRALLQPGMAKIGSGLGRLVTTTGTKFLEGLGYAASALPAIVEGDITVLTDNTFSKAMSNAEEYLKEETFPIYKTNFYKQGNILQQMGTLEFWTDDVVDGAAFMLQGLLGSAAISQVGKGLGVYGKLAKTFSNASRAAKTGKFAEISSPLAKFAGELDTFTMTAFNNVVESGFEAKDIKDSIMSQLQSKVDSGEITYEEANLRASEAARNTFLSNMAVLFPSNYLSNSLVFKSFNNSKSAVNRLFKEGQLISQDAVKDLSKRELIGVFGKNALKSVLAEGIWEENIQLAVQNYETQVAANNPTQRNRILGLANEFVNNFTTDEGQKSIVLGAIMGLIPGGIGGVRAAKDERSQLKNLRPIMELSIAGLEDNIQNFYKTKVVFDDNNQPIDTGAVELDQNNNPILDERKIVDAFKSRLQTNVDLVGAIEASATNKQMMFDFVQTKTFAEKAYPFLLQEGGIDILEGKLDQYAQQEIEDLQRTGQEIDVDFEQKKNDYLVKARQYQRILNTIDNYYLSNIDYRKFDNNALYFKNKLRSDLFSEAINQQFWQEQRDQLEKEKSELKDFPVFRNADVRGTLEELETKQGVDYIDNLSKTYINQINQKISQVDEILNESYNRYKNLLDVDKQTRRFNEENKRIQDAIEDIESKKEDISKDINIPKEEVTTGDIVSNQVVETQDDIIKPVDSIVNYYDEDNNLVQGIVQSYNEETDEYSIINPQGNIITLSRSNILRLQESYQDLGPNKADFDIETISEGDVPSIDQTIENEAKKGLKQVSSLPDVISYTHYEEDDQKKFKLNVRNTDFNTWVSNKNNKLTNAIVEFSIDLDESKEFIKKYWSNKQDLKNKIQSGKLTQDEINKVLFVPEGKEESFVNLVDTLPLKIKFKDGSVETTNGLYFNTSKNKALRQRRSEILKSLLAGNTYISSGISKKGTGIPNNIGKNQNISKAFNTNPDNIKIGIADNTGVIRTSSSSTMLGNGMAGNVYAETYNTSNGGQAVIKLNPSKLSKQHAVTLFKAIRQSYTKNKGFASIYEGDEVQGLTAGQVIDFLVLFGAKKTSMTYIDEKTGADNSKLLPSYLIDKQLYVENGKLLRYGANGRINVHEHTQEELNDFINWATTKKNYSVSKVLRRFDTELDGRFKNGFKVNDIIVNKGDKYSSVLIKNNMIVTDVAIDERSGSLFKAPIINIGFNNIEISNKQITEPKVASVQPPKEVIQNVKKIEGNKIEVKSSNDFKNLPIGTIVYRVNKEFDENKNIITKTIPLFEVGPNGEIVSKNRFDNELKSLAGNDVTKYSEALYKIYIKDKQIDLLIDIKESPIVDEIKETSTTEEPIKPKDSSDDIMNKYGPTLFDVYTIKDSEYKKIDLDKELKWLDDKLGDVDVKVMDGIIHTALTGRLAFGQFTRDHILISNVATEGTVYHEAFHRVSLAYLSDQERQKIYNEARDKYNLKDQSDYQVEEFLAEEFRKYVLLESNYKPKGNIIINLFKRIWQAIINFFNKSTELDIDKLFKSIQYGKYKYDEITKENYDRLKNLDYFKEVRGVQLQSIDTTDQLRKLIRGLSYILIKENNVTSLESIGEIKFSKLIDVLNSLSDAYKYEASQIKDKDIATNKLRLSGLYKEVVDNIDLFRGLINDELASLNILTREEDPEDPDTSNVSNDFEKYDKASYETSAKDNILSSVKLLIGTLHRSAERDPFTGMFEFVDFTEMWHKLERDIHDAETYEEMVDRITKKSKDYFPYQVLLKRLQEDNTEYEQLRTQFKVALTKYRHNFYNILFNLDEDGHASFGFNKADTQSLANLQIKSWNQGFIQSGLFTKEEGKKSILDKSKVEDINNRFSKLRNKLTSEFRVSNTIGDINSYKSELISLLREYSIGVDEETIEQILGELDQETYELRLIHLFNTTINPIFTNDSSIYKIAGNQELKTKTGKVIPAANIFSNESSIKLLAEAYSKSHVEQTADNVLGPGNASYHLFAQNNFLTDSVRYIKNNTDNYFDKLSSSIYQLNSYFLNQLKDNKVKKNFDIITVGGIFEEEAGDIGRNYLEITPIEDYLFKLSASLNDLLPLPTLADKKSYFLYKGIKRPNFKYIVQDNKLYLPDEVVDIFVGYVEDEFNRINLVQRQLNEAKETSNYSRLVRNYHFAVNERGDRDYENAVGLKYQHFTSLRGDSLTDRNGLFDKNEARKKVRKILEDRISDNIKYAKDLGIIEATNKNVPTINYLLDTNVVQEYSSELGNDESRGIQGVIADYTMTTILASIETEKIISGDPAFYKIDKKKQTTEDDKIKRLSVLSSTGDLLRLDVPGLNRTNYNTTTFVSNKIASSFYNTLKNKHIELYKQYFKDKVAENQLDKFVEEFVVKQLKGYAEEKKNNELKEKVDQTDAQVYISPEFYRELNIRLGEWNDEKQQAFNLLQSDEELTIEQEVKARNIVMQPLKFVYFGYDFTDGSAVPDYDKMSMAVLFRKFTKGTQLDELLDRMEAKGKYSNLDKIDQVKFDSAVKVGNRMDADYFIDKEDTQIINLENIKSYSQDLRFLRRQLITDPHEIDRQLFGTQVKKILMSNIIKDAEYDKGVTGQDIINTINKSLSSLSNKGKDILLRRLGISKDLSSIDDSVFMETLRKDAKMSGMPDSIIEALKVENGEVYLEIDALPDRKWIYTRIISLINKSTVDTKLPGGQFIQMSNFGLRSIQTDNSLKLLDDKGRMECMVSTTLLKNIIPNFEGMTYEQQRSWVKQNKDTLTIIGYRIPTQGMNSVAPLVIVDVLPEQVGDTIVLPAEFTALTGSDFDIDKLYIAKYNYTKDKKNNTIYKVKFIDLPTDNDSNLEKYYNARYKSRLNLLEVLKDVKDKVKLKTGFIINLARQLDYEEQLLSEIVLKETNRVLENWNITQANGETLDELIEELETIPTLESFINENKGKDVYELNSREAVENKLLDAYYLILLNDNHFIDRTTPLDADTDVLKAIVKKVRNAQPEYHGTPESLSTVTPDYQIRVKSQFGGGKQGIGPFALANAHHILAQINDLKMIGEIGAGNTIETSGGQLIDLSQKYGIDNKTISSWLSALISAHVDISKDPYIFDLNVNKYTYGVTNLLIRAGVGESTFYYLSQPILKELAEMAARSRGRIGKINPKTVVKVIRTKWSTKLAEANKISKLSEEQIDDQIDMIDIFDKEQLDKDLEIKNNTEYYIRQLAYLERFVKLRKLSSFLDNGVMVSQVDTKKYGKNVAEIQSYLSNVKRVYEDGRLINFDKILPYDTISNTVPESDSFLGTYLNNGPLLANKIFSLKTITANPIVLKMANDILAQTGNLYLMNKEDRLYLINQVNDEIFSSLVSRFFTASELFDLKPNFVRSLFFGNNTLAHQIYRLKSQEKYQNNPFINQLTPVFSDNTEEPNFVTMANAKMKDKWMIDDIKSGWEDLLNDDNIDVKRISVRLLVYSFYTSGFKSNLYSFFNFIPPKALKLLNVPLIAEDQEKNISYNQFIKTLNNLLLSDNGNLIYNQTFNEVLINNWRNDKLVPVVTNKSLVDIGTSKGEVVISGISNKNLYIGRTKTDEPLYTPYVLVNYNKKEGQIYLMKYIGYIKDKETPIYATVEKKGYSKSGYIIKEYGLDETVIPTNKIKTKYTEEQMISIANKKYPDFIRLADEDKVLQEKIDVITSQISDNVENEIESVDINLPNVNLQMQPSNIQKILNGTKTTTTRSQRQADQIGLAQNQSGQVEFEGRKFKITNRGELTIEEAGGKNNMLRSEGVSNESEFMFQQTKDWINGKGKLFVYDIEPIIEQLEDTDIFVDDLTLSKQQLIPTGYKIFENDLIYQKPIYEVLQDFAKDSNISVSEFKELVNKLMNC